MTDAALTPRSTTLDRAQDVAWELWSHCVVDENAIIAGEPSVEDLYPW